MHAILKIGGDKLVREEEGGGGEEDKIHRVSQLDKFRGRRRREVGSSWNFKYHVFCPVYELNFLDLFLILNMKSLPF